MSITYFNGGVVLTGLGDTAEGIQRVSNILFRVNGTNTGAFVLKDGAGVIIMQPRIGGTDANGGQQELSIPVDTDLDGIELDARPSGARITIFHR